MCPHPLTPVLFRICSAPSALCQRESPPTSFLQLTALPDLLRASPTGCRTFLLERVDTPTHSAHHFALHLSESGLIFFWGAYLCLSPPFLLHVCIHKTHTHTHTVAKFYSFFPYSFIHHKLFFPFLLSLHPVGIKFECMFKINRVLVMKAGSLTVPGVVKNV